MTKMLFQNVATKLNKYVCVLYKLWGLVQARFCPVCRYIQAATSPKDIIIMVDISGSMKGLKITIAKHTINTILDTLGENDFVNVIAVRTKFLLKQQ